MLKLFLFGQGRKVSSTKGPRTIINGASVNGMVYCTIDAINWNTTPKNTVIFCTISQWNILKVELIGYSNIWNEKQRKQGKKLMTPFPPPEITREKVLFFPRCNVWLLSKNQWGRSFSGFSPEMLTFSMETLRICIWVTHNIMITTNIHGNF